MHVAGRKPHGALGTLPVTRCALPVVLWVADQFGLDERPRTQSAAPGRKGCAPPRRLCAAASAPPADAPATHANTLQQRTTCAASTVPGSERAAGATVCASECQVPLLGLAAPLSAAGPWWRPRRPTPSAHAVHCGFVCLGWMTKPCRRRFGLSWTRPCPTRGGCGWQGRSQPRATAARWRQQGKGGRPSAMPGAAALPDRPTGRTELRSPPRSPSDTPQPLNPKR